jgi:CelD/BcsL family acetyltransferase involved in cellulose biosynthesis
MSRVILAPFGSAPSIDPAMAFAAHKVSQPRPDGRPAAAPAAVTATSAAATGGTQVAIAPAGLTFELIEDQAAFSALEAEWTDLFERAGHGTQVFQTFSWNWHWCRHFVWPLTPAARQTCAIITARHRGRLVMVWPLAMERVGLLRQLIWMGEPVSQYGDILADSEMIDGAGIAAGWTFALQTLKPDVVRLRRVRADAVITPHLNALPSLKAVTNEAPYLDLASAPDFAAYEQRYSGKARKNRRRLARRLDELGTVKYTSLSGRTEAGSAAAQAVAMKQSWLRDRGLLSPALADPRFAAFMSDVASTTERTAGMNVSVLSLNDQPVGIQIGVIAKQRLALHVIVYDLSHEKSGVGVLHLERAIADAYDQGLKTIDLLAPKADYKMDWADGTVDVVDHAVPISTAGQIYAHVYLGFIREHAKALAQRLPASISRHLIKRG